MSSCNIRLVEKANDQMLIKNMIKVKSVTLVLSERHWNIVEVKPDYPC